MHATNVFAMSTAPVQLIRGGATEAAFDLTRARIRLEGLSSYGVIAVLLMNSALRLYTSVPKKIKGPDEEDAKIENAATIVFTCLNSLCIVSGITTTIIYSLVGLYCKTALALGNDSGYMKFLSATADVRNFGFMSMIVSLFSFKGSFVASTFLYFKGRPRYVLSAAVLLLAILSSMIWLPIIGHATQLIF